MGKKGIVIALVAVLLLGGGGGAAYLLLGGGGLASAPAEPNPGYVDFASISKPVVRDGRLHHYVHLAVTLELFDEDDVDLVEGHIPALRDAFLRALFRAPEAGGAAAGEADLDDIKARLLEIANQVAGEGVVRAVLVTRTQRGPA
jgi:flagellar FliL protein